MTLNVITRGGTDTCPDSPDSDLVMFGQNYKNGILIGSGTDSSMSGGSKPCMAIPANEEGSVTFGTLLNNSDNTEIAVEDNNSDSSDSTMESQEQNQVKPDEANSFIYQYMSPNSGTEKGTKPLELSECDLFLSFYNEWRSYKFAINNASYKAIPKFYIAIPEDADSLPLKLREEGRSLFLQRRSVTLLDNNELRTLWDLLDKHHTPPNVRNEQLITYIDLKKVVSKASSKCKEYFTAKLFAQLQQNDVYNRVNILALFNYAMRKAWLQQTRIGLSLYDASGKGYLRESDLESYILDLIPTLPQLDGLEKSFHSFYVCTAVRKFLFFLDPMRTGKIRVQDILACSFLDDLLELRDGDLPKDLQDANWFSAPSALRVYGQYLNLDKDHNGMLSKTELSGLGTGTLTSVFLERVYQECLTYEGEMDYKTYLDFVLALENRQEPQSLHYFFRILDIKGNGYLDSFTLNYFFRAIQDQIKQNGQEPVSFHDVKDEMFDMIKPADPSKITLQDILNCGQGGTLVSILIDLNGFWNHENRETRSIEDPTDI